MSFKNGYVFVYPPAVQRSREKLAIVYRAKLSAASEACDRCLDFVPYPLRKIDKPPALYPIRRRYLLGLDFDQASKLFVVQD